MYDIMLMGKLESFSDLDNNLYCLINIQKSFLCRQFVESVALDILHANKMNPVLFSNIINLHNVGMVESGYGVGLSLKSGDEFRIGTKDWRKNFKCDDAIQGNLAGLIDYTHPATTQKSLDFIITQCRSRKIVNIHFVPLMRKINGCGCRMSESGLLLGEIISECKFDFKRDEIG